MSFIWNIEYTIIVLEDCYKTFWHFVYKMYRIYQAVINLYSIVVSCHVNTSRHTVMKQPVSGHMFFYSWLSMAIHWSKLWITAKRTISHLLYYAYITWQKQFIILLLWVKLNTTVLKPPITLSKQTKYCQMCFKP